ncbi:MAG: hypothetical protein RL150_416 [Candidatus Parcubacteria bacterium]|jgi:hypothetical protein
MTSNSGGRSLLGKILFVVGVVIILIILGFLIIKFVPRVLGGLANVGSSFGSIFGKDEITVSADTLAIENGDTVKLSWEHDNKNKPGAYGITYECTDNVEVDILTDAGARRLVCGNIYTLGFANSRAAVKVMLKEANSFADVPLQVYFTESGNTTPVASGTVVITVQDGNPTAGTGDLSGDAATIESEPAPETSTTQKTTTTQPKTTTASPRSVGTTYVATGPADLTVTNVIASNTQVGFTVSNIGGRSSGTWVFSYNTPTNPKETFTSPLQLSLAPGQAIRYTLTFGAKASDNQTVAIVADSTSSVSEASESNNIGTVTMTGSAYGNGGSSNNGSSNNTNGNYDEDDDADFVIEDLEVGRYSGNRFTEDDNVDEGDDVAVRFTVRNRGGEETDDWRFEIKELPYDRNDTFRSREYDSLRPGETIEIIVELDNTDEGNYDIEVEVDSEDDTDEERENNNKRSVDLEVEN